MSNREEPSRGVYVFAILFWLFVISNVVLGNCKPADHFEVHPHPLERYGFEEEDRGKPQTKPRPPPLRPRVLPRVFVP